MDYHNNLISKESEDRLKWVYNGLKPEEKTGEWLPFNVYDMVQSGYPRPDHGIMVARDFGGSDKDGKNLPPNGMWCKVEEARLLVGQIDALEEVLRRIAFSLGVGGYNSTTVDPEVFYQKIDLGITRFAEDYHRMKTVLAAKKL